MTEEQKPQTRPDDVPNSTESDNIELQDKDLDPISGGVVRE